LKKFFFDFPKRIWFFSVLIFFGVLLVNLSHIETFDINVLLLGGLPVLIAVFCYPFGNQLVWEAENGYNKRLPYIVYDSVWNWKHGEGHVMRNPTLGS
jgi:drug/metabolite transporter (DMT)-like permease